MLMLFPKKVSFESELTDKQLKKSFDRKIIPFKARGSIIEVSSFIKKYKTAEVFYGSRDGSKVRMSHHAPKKTDGSSATFYGEIKPKEEGSVIEGKIMLPVATQIFGAVWVLCVLFFALVCLATEVYAGAIAFTVAAVVSVWLLYRDMGKTQKLCRALSEICKEENNKN